MEKNCLAGPQTIPWAYSLVVSTSGQKYSPDLVPLFYQSPIRGSTVYAH